MDTMDAMELTLARILIVDDQEINIGLLERILRRSGFSDLHSTMDALKIGQLVEEVGPDIVLLDLHMPEMDGLQALEVIRERKGGNQFLPVLMLTADMTAEARRRGLQAGVDDFLTKPYDRTEVVLRINNLLRTRFLHLQLQRNNSLLEEKVQERTRELSQAQSEMLQLLGRAGEFRDDMTGQHTVRVGSLSGLIAKQFGLSDHEADLIRRAAPLHDIGKIGIPDELLLKPGRYEPEEFERMKEHALIGESILAGSTFEVLKLAGTIARSHHERWDGNGYPQGLRGEEIPVAARIVALADFYDALTHERPYKRAWTHEEALEEIMRQRGLHFDPRVVDAWLALAEREEDQRLREAR
ncbi:HD-GYP domain-containing protein [Cohnella suwonensis]|uniref:HD-GYP domain-containing protein n=1 Tax=Cohnella suwonensis TaxID=696072 RepID=A0ABW0M287_9BACL